AVRARATCADGAFFASDQPVSASARSAGGSSTPRDDDREAVVLEEAVGIRKACLTEPVELLLDGRTAVVTHAIQRAVPLVVAGAEGARGALVAMLVDLVEPGRRAGDLLGVDEDTAVAQPAVHAVEEGSLVVVGEVVDRQGGDHGVPGAGGQIAGQVPLHG